MGFKSSNRLQYHELECYAIGIGEKQEDLNVFEAEPYARAMLGLEINES